MEQKENLKLLFKELQAEVFNFIQFDKRKRKLKKTHIEETFTLQLKMEALKSFIEKL